MIAWYWFVIAYFVGILITMLIEVLVNVICSIPIILHRVFLDHRNKERSWTTLGKWFKCWPDL